MSYATDEAKPATERRREADFRGTSRSTKAFRALSYRNIGAVYVWLVFVVAFTVWIPPLFPTWSTAQQILNEAAPTALISLALVVPLCTRTFDLSIGWVATLSGVIVAYLITKGFAIAPAVAIAIVAALAVGLINAVIVVVLGVDSFIATLATGSIAEALVTMVTNGTPITSPALLGSFANIAQVNVVGGLTLPVLYAVVLAVVIWYVLEHMATGRRLYATGFNIESARLAGVKTAHLRFWSLLVSAGVAGVAGVVIASNLGTGDPSVGTSYLLPAYAATFLGATQLRPGRFNAWGVVIAVILLQTGTVGLGLATAPNWTSSMFVGLVLIAALAITGKERKWFREGRSGLWRRPTDALLTPPEQDGGTSVEADRGVRE